ncbi:MAG: hypothetical protein WBM44_30245 [Waterburya sp.]
MNNIILPIEADQHEPRIVSRESNLDLGQFFYPDERSKRFEIRKLESKVTDKQGNCRITKISINPNPTLGGLTTFDERVMYAFLELWKEQDQPDKINFSVRELIKRLKITKSSTTLKAVKDSIIRLGSVFFEWESSFYLKKDDKYLELLTPFTILTNIKLVTTKNKGIGAALCQCSLAENFLENLKANYCRPVRFDVVLSLKTPLAQAVYTLIDRKLFGTKEYHRTTAGLLIDDLGLKAKSYQRKAIRVEKLKKIREELLNVPLSFGEVIEVYEVDNNRNEDAVLYIQRSGEQNIKTRKVAYLPSVIPLEFEPPSQATQDAPRREKNPSPKHNPRQEKKPLKSPSKSLSEPETLVRYFYSVFAHQSDPHISQAALREAKKLIKDYGLDQGRKFVDFAKQQAAQTHYQPKSLQGILQYLGDWKKQQSERARQQRIDQREQEKLRKTHSENSRINHEKTYQSAYFDYVDLRLEVICEESPADYIAFDKAEKQQLQELETAVFQATKSQKKIAELQLKIFNRRGQKVIRAVDFFKDKKLPVLDFWQWDNQMNPEKFQK